MKKILILFTMCLQSCISSSTLHSGCNVFVDNNAKGTDEHHFVHFSDALRSVSDGGTICFNEGVYDGIQIEHTDGGIDKITVMATPNHTVILRGKGYKGSGVKIVNSHNISIKNITIAGSLYGIYAISSSDLEILNNNISNIGQEGIIIKAGKSANIFNNFLIQGNKISDTGKSLEQYGEGIYIGDGSGVYNGTLVGIHLLNNSIDGTTNEAIDIKVNSTNIIVHNNIITNTSLLFNGAITVGTSSRNGPASSIIISNNLIYKVDNRSGYRPIGIAIGHGNVEIKDNQIIEENTNFVGICLYTTFVNPLARQVRMGYNEILTKGTNLIKRCGDGGTGAKNAANVEVLL